MVLRIWHSHGEQELQLQTETNVAEEPGCIKPITDTAGTPWSYQKMEWSQCCFEELLTWRPDPISMSLLGQIHGPVVWSQMLSTFREGLDHIPEHERAAGLCQHKIWWRTHMGMSINLSHLVKLVSSCTWDWTEGTLFFHLFALDVLLL